jgi:hypothetical protein
MSAEIVASCYWYVESAGAWRVNERGYGLCWSSVLDWMSTDAIQFNIVIRQHLFSVHIMYCTNYRDAFVSKREVRLDMQNPMQALFYISC